MNRRKGARSVSRQRGAVLAVALVLLTVLTLLAVSGMTTTTLELQMAGNEQYQERAFQAAEAGIERAIQAGVYNTTATIGTYVPSGNPAIPPTPRRGTGVAGCVRTIADDDATAGSEDCYEYFMRYEAETATLPGGYSLDPGLHAYHFVVDVFGTSNRDAASDLTQGFYVVAGAPPECVTAEDCDTTLSGPPVRTYWRQRGGS